MVSRKDAGLQELLDRAEQEKAVVNSLLEEYKDSEWEELEEQLEKEIKKHSNAHEKLTKEIKTRYETLLDSSTHHVEAHAATWVLRKFSKI